YRYSSSLGWFYRGVSVDLNASTASKTTSTGYGYNGYLQRITRAALSTNLTMSYDFEQGDLFRVPGWLQETTITLKVLNVLDDHTEYDIVDLDLGEPTVYYDFNANSIDPRG